LDQVARPGLDVLDVLCLVHLRDRRARLGFGGGALRANMDTHRS